jgi:hypothetical protein
MLVKFNKPKQTGKIREESTSIKLGIQPKPPTLNSVKVSWA